MRLPAANLSLGILALAVETVGWVGLWQLAERPNVALSVYLALHAVASVLLPLALFPLFARHFIKSRAFALALMVACGFVVPILGFLGLAAAFSVLRRFLGGVQIDQFETLELPEFDPQQQLKHRVRSVGLRSFLLDSGVAAAKRERAMALLNYISKRAATPILQRILRDPNEELRLLAYGMLNRFETDIGRRITAQSELLHTAEPGSLQALRSAKALSDLHWELIETGLAREDLRVHAMGAALSYCERVLQRKPDDGAMQLRRARLLHQSGSTQRAEEAYGFARALGMPPTRVLPHLARQCFEQREFARVRAIMQDLKTWRALPQLRRVIDYWGQA